MIVHTGVTGDIRQVTYAYEGWRTVAIVTPLPESVRGGNPETHALVTILCADGTNRAHVFAKTGFLSRPYFEEKIGTFGNDHIADAAYIVTAEALLREYERDEEDSLVR